MWTVVGHEKNKKYFEAAFRAGLLSHAYIFSGPEMIGKKRFALDLYRFINKRADPVRSLARAKGASPEDLQGEGSRRGTSAGIASGEATSNGTDFDFKSIFPKVAENETKIYIEDIRAIKSFLSLRPNVGPYKFVIIDDAHRLTPESSNALLKILEEPPSFSILILISSMPSLLPQTIVSRCQSVSFLPDRKAASSFIKSKKLKISDEEFLVKMSNGRIGWAARLIESGKISEAIKLVSDLDKLTKEGIFERLTYAKKSYESEIYPVAVDYWLEWIHGNIDSQGNPKMLSRLLELRKIISQPQFNHRLALENFLINL